MRIRVGALDYRVEEVDALRDEKGEELSGYQDYEQATIRLAADRAPSPKFITLWHEVVHAIESQHGWNLSEEMVSALADAIVQVLRDNPAMRVPPT